MTGYPPTHTCPGCTAQGVQNRSLACVTCWARIPEEMKRDLLVSYRDRVDQPVHYHTTRAATLAWLRASRV